MKFSFRQILASAGGGVLAAVIASFFGVKGTIVGVAIGSAAATFGTALVAQSIERGHQAVKQVVVRAPDTALLRRMGGTRPSGAAEAVTAVEEAVPTVAEDAATTTGQVDETTVMNVTGPDADPVTDVTDVTDATEVVGVTGVTGAVDGAPTSELPLQRIVPVEAAGDDQEPARRQIRWPVIVGTAAIVFVFSLMFVTAIELIAGQPLADLFGGHSANNDPSVGQIFAPATTTTSTSTTTTSTVPATTTTSTSTTTTSTTTPATGTGTGSDTTTTSVPGTTTTIVGGTSTTTSTAPSVTTTTKPG